MSQQTQKPDYPAPQSVHQEIRTAENSAAYLLPKLRAMKESNPNLAILDVGAGSGTISATFAKAVPEGKVTATDVNKDVLPRAQAIAEMQDIKNIEFMQADVFKLPFPDATFDITHCHQVLTHLKAPADALREMLRVTKPGGVVAAREGDFETEALWPELPGLVKFHKLVAGFLKMAGGTPMGGRQLLSWALQAGAERSQVTLTYGTWCYVESAEKGAWVEGIVNALKAGRMREGGLKAGLTTESDIEEMIKAWEEWNNKDDASLGMMHGEVIIQK